MTDNEDITNTPSENNPGGCAGIAALIGLVVAFAPPLFLDIRVSWAVMFFSIPIGILIALMGFAGSLIGAARNPDDRSATNLDEMTGQTEPPESDAAKPNGSPASNTRFSWDVTPVVTKKILILNSVATFLVIAATVINVGSTIANFASFASGGLHPLAIGIIFFQSIPIPLVLWLLVLAMRTHDVKGTPAAVGRFALLERIQRVVGLGSLVSLLVVVPVSASRAESGVNPFEVIAGFVPTLTGIVAMIITLSVRGKLEEAVADKKTDPDVA